MTVKGCSVTDNMWSVFAHAVIQWHIKLKLHLLRFAEVILQESPGVFIRWGRCYSRQKLLL
jgi:hypothetical protein